MSNLRFCFPFYYTIFIDFRKKMLLSHKRGLLARMKIKGCNAYMYIVQRQFSNLTVISTLLLCTLVVLVAMEEEQTLVVTRQCNGHRIHAMILRLTGRQWFSAHL